MCEVAGRDAYSGFGLDVGAQFEGAQRVQAVLGERPVGIDGATQDQADLVGDQTPQPGGPLVAGQLVEFGKEFACARLRFARGAERFGERAALRRRRSATVHPIIGA